MPAEPLERNTTDVEDLAGRVPPEADGHRQVRAHRPTLMTFLSRVQLLIALPAAILIVIAIGSFVYASYLTVHLIFSTAWVSTKVSENVVRALQVIDVCLIGVAALVIAADALVLFMSKSPARPSTPRWLDRDTETVDVLKNRALALVVLIMSVTFLEGIAQAHSGTHELDLGFSIAAVIAAIGIYLLAGWIREGRPSHRSPPS